MIKTVDALLSEPMVNKLLCFGQQPRSYIIRPKYYIINADGTIGSREFERTPSPPISLGPILSGSKCSFFRYKLTISESDLESLGILCALIFEGKYFE